VRGYCTNIRRIAPVGEERKGESHATDGVGSKARLPMKQLTAWWRIIAAKERGGHGMSRPEGSESTKTILYIAVII